MLQLSAESAAFFSKAVAIWTHAVLPDISTFNLCKHDVAEKASYSLRRNCDGRRIEPLQA